MTGIVRTEGSEAAFDIHDPIDRSRALHLFLFSLLIGMLTYGFAIFSFTLTIDQEIAALAPNPALSWLAQGRWGTYLLNTLLFPHPIMPVLPTTIFVAALAASYVLTSITWGWPPCAAHYAGAPFAIALPVLVHIVAFTNLAYAVALGFLFGALAVHLAARRQTWPAIAAVVPTTVAVSIYQPILMFPLASFLVLSALRLPEDGAVRAFKSVLAFAGMLAVSLVLYYAIWRFLLAWMNLEASHVDQFFQFEALFSSPVSILKQTLAFAGSILSGSSDVFVEEKRRIFGMTMILAMALAAWSAWRRTRTFIDFASTVLLLATAVFSTLLVVVIDFGSLPYRTLLGAPIGIAGLVFFAMSHRNTLAMRWVLGILCALCMVGFASAANRVLYAHFLAGMADRDLANRVIDRLTSVGAYSRSQCPIVEFVGAHAIPASRLFIKVNSSTLGASFFEWDLGNPMRIRYFLGSMGHCVREASGQERSILLDRIREMPSWPDPDSVRLIDGLAVVKFSDYTWAQNARYGLGP
jgi:hypothetical protein